MKKVFDLLKERGIEIGDMQNIAISNMKSPVTGDNVANQFDLMFYFSGGKARILKSYESIVVCVVFVYGGDTIVFLGPDHDYSNTTVKYRNKFLASVGYPSNSKDIDKAVKAGDILLFD